MKVIRGSIVCLLSLINLIGLSGIIVIIFLIDFSGSKEEYIIVSGISIPIFLSFLLGISIVFWGCKGCYACDCQCLCCNCQCCSSCDKSCNNCCKGRNLDCNSNNDCSGRVGTILVIIIFGIFFVFAIIYGIIYLFANGVDLRKSRIDLIMIISVCYFLSALFNWALYKDSERVKYLYICCISIGLFILNILGMNISIRVPCLLEDYQKNHRSKIDQPIIIEDFY